MDSKVKLALDLFNNGSVEEIESYFGGFDTALKYFEKKGVLDEIDPFKIDDIATMNSVIYGMLQSNVSRQKIMDKLIGRLSDVTKEGDDYYFDVRNRTELADFFKDYSRDTSPHDVAKGVLSEDFWEPFGWDTTDDVYRDVIDELTPENKKTLMGRILKDLDGVNIEITGQSTDLMERLSSEQGNNDYFVVTPENVSEIVEDEETMDLLLKDELSDLRGDLHNIHSNAYNSAYTDELYDDVWSELGQIIADPTPIQYKWANTYRDKYKLNKSYLFGVINEWFNEYRGYNDDFDYYGSFSALLEHMMETYNSNYERLDFRIPDYPNSSRVDKYINDYFDV